MKSGYWLNSRNHRFIEVDDHNSSMRDGKTAALLGISQAIVRAGAEKYPRDRIGFLSFILENTPACRIRGRGEYTVIECREDEGMEPLAAVASFVKAVLCETSLIRIVNLRTTKEQWFTGSELCGEKGA